MTKFKFSIVFLIANITLMYSLSFGITNGGINKIFIKELDFPFSYYSERYINDIDDDGKTELIVHFYSTEKQKNNYIAIFDVSSNKVILKTRSEYFGAEKRLQIIGIAHNPRDKKKSLLLRIDNRLRWYSLRSSKLIKEAEQDIPIRGDIRFVTAGYLTNADIEDIVVRVTVRADPKVDWITKEVIFSWNDGRYKKVWESLPTYKHQKILICDLDGDKLKELLIQTGGGPITEGVEIIKWIDNRFVEIFRHTDIFSNYETPHLICSNFANTKTSQLIISTTLLEPYGAYEMAIFKWNDSKKQLDKYLICSDCFPYPITAGDIDSDGIDELFVFEKGKIKFYKLKFIEIGE